MKMYRTVTLTALAGLALLTTSTALAAQSDAQKRGSDNIEVIAHLPLGPQAFRPVT